MENKLYCCNNIPENVAIQKQPIMDGMLTGYPSIDKPWLRFYPSGADNIAIPEKTIFQLLEDSNIERMNATLMNFNGIKISAKKYLEMIKKTALSLDKLNVKQNEIILTMMPNVPESRTLIYADNILNSIIYPVTPMISPVELDRIIRENEIRKIFIFEMFFEKYRSVIEKNKTIEAVIISDGRAYVPKPLNCMIDISKKIKGEKKVIPFGDNYIQYNEFLDFSKSNKRILKPEYIPNQTAAIIGTSGTTGIPKGVCLTNENLNAMALQHKYGDMNFEVGDKLLDLLIQSIGYGIGVAHYSGVCGIESILIPTLETNILPLIDKYNPLHFTGGPIHYETLLKELEKNNRNKPKIKNMVSGGASLDIDVEKKLNEITDDGIIDENKVFVRQGLGCTENGGAATYSKKGAYAVGSVGIPLCLETMSVFEPGTDRELKYNEQGELCILGPTVMKGYLNNEIETDIVLKKHSDGNIWLHTGDLGYMDECGRVYLTDRIKNIFMRKGFNVHPNSIQKFISSFDFIDSCYVTGIEHPTEQIVPVAFVKFNENIDKTIAIKQLEMQCSQNLEEASIPYEFIVVNEFPRNLGGKIDKNKLIEMNQVSYTNMEKKKILK